MKFVTSKHLKYLKHVLESKHEFSHAELYLKPLRTHHGCYSKYMTLKQDTEFFNNLVYVLETVFTSSNEEEWCIKLDLKRIPQEIANFAVAYAWMCPHRWFTFDWRCKNSDYILSGCQEYCVWNIVDSWFKKIAREHLPMCTVDDFISWRANI